MPTTSWQSPERQHHHHEAQKAFDTFISSTNGKHFRIYVILAELGSFCIQRDAVFHNFIGLFGSTVLKPEHELQPISGFFADLHSNPGEKSGHLA